MEARVAWSNDGGANWTIADGTSHQGYLRSLDAIVPFDLHGHAFLSWLAMDSISLTARHGQFVRRSDDGGRTWGAVVTLAAHPGNQAPVLEHFPNLVVDNHPESPNAGHVYVVWDRQLADERTDMVLARSTDDGKTWSRPRVIGSHPNRLAHATAIGRDGTVYLMYTLFRKDHSEILIESSRDGGQTFGAPQRVGRIDPPTAKSWAPADFPRAGGWPVMAIDSRSLPARLFVVWGDDPHGDRDIFVATSVDGGRTWSSPVRVNDDPKSNGKDQAMEWVAVDPTDGSVYVIFYDRPGDPTNLRPMVTLARSSDGGRTWVDYAWTESPTDPRESSLGDYLGLAAMNRHVYGAWPESIPPAGGTPRRSPSDDLVWGIPWPSGRSVLRVGIADFTAPR